MKNVIILFSLLLSIPCLAQTKVVKKNAVKANDFGITYSLPKTALVVGAEVTKVTCKAGPYYQYADKYLSIKDVVTEDNVYYELSDVTLENRGLPDEEQTYIVSFKAGTVAPYAYLTEDGLLCTINAPYEPEQKETEEERIRKKRKTATPNASVLSEELLMAGSTAKQAEVAAKQIYRIRESRLNILTGDADNLPPDGEAMKIVIQQLEEQEEALTALFVLTATERAPELDPKEAEKKEKSLKGIIYNVPGKADVEVYSPKKDYFKGSVQVTQFGTHEGLAPVMFEDKKAPVKVYFYPETGAIKQIIQ